MANLDKQKLETKIKEMYRDVAQSPKGNYHFEMGRGLAEKLGYLVADLDKIPQEAIDSFAGVGYFFDLVNLESGERVLDLGSGSGMDVFYAALKVGERGNIVGIDMTVEQLAKSEALRKYVQLANILFVQGRIEELPFPNESFDAVISNGVINLSPEKETVFKEVARVLRPGGRMSVADIVTEKPLTEGITCDATIWASCIGGAMQINAYKQAIESAGLSVVSVKENPQYQFLSKSAQGAIKDFGVKSICLLARKTA